MLSKESKELLKLLIETPSPSGIESELQKMLKEHISPLVSTVETDIHGNMIAYKPGKTNTKIALIGHCDEIGLMVTCITDQGFLRFDGVAPAGPQVLKGQHVVILNQNKLVYGVIGADDFGEDDEEQKNNQKTTTDKLAPLWIDIGARSKEEALEQVSVGDQLVVTRKLKDLGRNFVTGQGLDGKAGVFVWLETFRNLVEKKLNPHVYGISSVQEEISSAGALTAVYKVNPQVAIVIDVTSAMDYPSAKKEKYGDLKTGGGPVICRGIPINNALSNMLIQTAEQLNIPYQVSAEPKNTHTDADKVFMSREGIATAVINVPMRYIHTPVEIMCVDDLVNTVTLVTGFLERFPENKDFRPVK